MWTYAQSTFHTERSEAPVSYHAAPDLGEPPLWMLSPLSKCKVVRLSLACNKGIFTRAAWPYKKRELSTCIETMTMTQMTCSNLLSHSNMSIYPNPSDFPVVTREAQSTRVQNLTVSQNLKYWAHVPLSHLIMKNNMQVYPFIRKLVFLQLPQHEFFKVLFI